MLDRLKSLPLTIVLTILIWMYAESQVTSPQGTARLDVKGVPVLAAGAPDVLSPVHVEVEPRTVDLIVSGPQEAIDRLHNRIVRSGVKSSGIFAYLDIDANDEPDGRMIRRQLRYSLPDGVMLYAAPADVTCRITPEQATTTRTETGPR